MSCHQKRRLSVKLLLFLFAIFLTSCSTLSLTYNFADWLLYWKIDRYFDLSSQQKPQLQTQISQFHSWHRQEEIPRYVSFLQTIHNHWQDGLNQEELDDLFQQYHRLKARLGTRLASESIGFLTTVHSQQIQHLERAIQIENQELLDQIGEDPDVRKAKRVDSVLEWLEEWLGHIRVSQRQRITQLITEFPDTTESWLQYRKYRQQELIMLLKSHADSSVIQRQIREWFIIPPKTTPRTYVSAVQESRQALKNTILTIDQMVTPDQRDHVSQRLFTLIQELDSLVLGSS